jgi:hypothetical protein
MPRIPRDFIADLVVSPSGQIEPFHAADAWMCLKARQRREDGTSARITPQHLERLATLPSHHSGPSLSVPPPAAPCRVETESAGANTILRRTKGRALALLRGGAE